MKFLVYAVLISNLALGVVALLQQRDIENLRKDLILDQSEDQDKRIDVLLDVISGKINRVQDSIEERIGDLERDVQDLQFVKGKKKLKQKTLPFRVEKK